MYIQRYFDMCVLIFIWLDWDLRTQPNTKKTPVLSDRHYPQMSHEA